MDEDIINTALIEDIRDYLKIYKVEERTEWRLSLVDEVGD